MNVSEPLRSAVEKIRKGPCRLVDYHYLQVGDKSLRFTFYENEGTNCRCDVVTTEGNLSDLIGHTIYSLDGKLVCAISSIHFSFDVTHILEGFEIRGADDVPLETQWADPPRLTGPICIA